MVQRINDDVLNIGLTTVTFGFKYLALMLCFTAVLDTILDVDPSGRTVRSPLEVIEAMAKKPKKPSKLPLAS